MARKAQRRPTAGLVLRRRRACRAAGQPPCEPHRRRAGGGADGVDVGGAGRPVLVPEDVVVAGLLGARAAAPTVAVPMALLWTAGAVPGGGVRRGRGCRAPV